jgi:hypothetical protein
VLKRKFVHRGILLHESMQNKRNPSQALPKYRSIRVMIFSMMNKSL